MDEDEHIKEVYAYYGLVMYHVQCVERGLCLLLALEKALSMRTITKYDYDNILNDLFKQTLGSLIKKMKESVEVADNFEANVERALKIRNWLAHHYFWERAGHFMTAEGRNFMLKELQQALRLFEDLYKYLDEITDEWAKKVGLTRELAEKKMEELIKSVKAPE